MLLIKAIHKCDLRYAELADSVMLTLLDFLNGPSDYEVMKCVKSVLEQYPAFRPSIVRKILTNFEDISSSVELMF